MNNCLFCNISDDREIIYESEDCIAFYDHFPVSPGHVLIIPKVHESDFFQLNEIIQKSLLLGLNECKKIISQRYNPAGFNVGLNVGEAAGQSVMHCHIHLIPRYKGDVPNPRGGVRGVIPTKQNY